MKGCKFSAGCGYTGEWGEINHPNTENATPSLCTRQPTPSDHGDGFSSAPAPSLHIGCLLETSTPVHNEAIQNIVLNTSNVNAAFFPDGGGTRANVLLIARIQKIMNVELRKD